jgi:predicted O-linked N-acetylglucosamine transferase (SPINDLY family)
MAIAPERVAFLGATDHHRHLESYGAVDIALDPFPQNGGITTFEALSMGVPVVTRLGATPLGRLGGSILTAMGLDELIASDDASYVEIARRSAADLHALATLRATLRERLQASPAGNPTRYVGAVEAAYRALWRRWCAYSSSGGTATP